jgi:hypothetical protein
MNTLTRPIIALLSTCALLVMASACATTEVTEDNLKRPIDILVAADMEGAQQNAQANAYYEMADQRLVKASYHIARDEDEKARRQIAMAESDALVALELARLDGRRDELTQIGYLENRLKATQARMEQQQDNTTAAR